MNANSPQGPKSFWKTFKPFFSNKCTIVDGRIILVENSTVISDDAGYATLFNNYFTTITHNLNIPKWNEDLVSTSADAIESAVVQYANHPSILTIKERFHNNECFDFKEARTHETCREIFKLDRSKNVQLQQGVLTKPYVLGNSLMSSLWRRLLLYIKKTVQPTSLITDPLVFFKKMQTNSWLFAGLARAF